MRRPDADELPLGRLHAGVLGALVDAEDPQRHVPEDREHAVALDLPALALAERDEQASGEDADVVAPVAPVARRRRSDAARRAPGRSAGAASARRAPSAPPRGSRTRPSPPCGQEPLLVGVVAGRAALDHREQQRPCLLVERGHRVGARATERSGGVLRESELGALGDRGLDPLVEPVHRLHVAELRVRRRAVRELVDGALHDPRGRLVGDEVLDRSVGETDRLHHPAGDPEVVRRRRRPAVEALRSSHGRSVAGQWVERPRNKLGWRVETRVEAGGRWRRSV